MVDRLRSAGKGAWTGAKVGALITPGNIILMLCGKKKAALIMTAIGAGVGSLIGFYNGWTGQKNIEEYRDKLKNDPEFRKQKKSELEEYIKDLLKTSPYPSDHLWKIPKDYKKSELPYRPDFYKYLDLYNKFCKKYYTKWIEAWKVLDFKEEIDAEFDIVFPTPYLDESSRPEEGYVAANGFAPSDHYYILWDEESGEYNDDLGSGRATGKTLLEACQKFASQWVVDERKIKDPKILEVAKIHNVIIKEFLKLKA